MKLSYIIFIILALFCQPSNSQTKAKITDVDYNLDNRYIVITYTLTGTLPKEQMTIELNFVNEKNESIIPKALTGDIGTKVYTDGAKAILWDIVADPVVLSGSLKALVSITSSKILFHGPSNAFLSILIPGLGGYLVDQKKGRAVFTTISTVGLMAYGLTQKIQANKYYKDYGKSTVPVEIQNMYTKANSAQHSYYIATRAAAGIWALDIIWVTFKGFHNRNQAKSAYSASESNGLRIDYVNNAVQMKYSVSF